jgi:hypothetical protein
MGARLRLGVAIRNRLSIVLSDRQVVEVDGLSITAREMGHGDRHADSYFTVQEGMRRPSPSPGTSLSMTRIRM